METIDLNAVANMGDVVYQISHRLPYLAESVETLQTLTPVYPSQIAFVEGIGIFLYNTTTEEWETFDIGTLGALVNAHIGSGGLAHAEATPETAGFMSAADKAKLDNIDEFVDIDSFPDQEGHQGKMLVTNGEEVSWSHGPTAVAVGTEAVLGEIRCAGPIRVITPSDARWKTNVRTIPPGDALNAVSQLRGVRFNWSAEYLSEHGGADGYYIPEQDLGFIAQEVRQVIPDVVAIHPDDGSHHIRYERLVAILVGAIQAQQEQINDLASRVASLER